jgi:hypothetical protein
VPGKRKLKIQKRILQQVIPTLKYRFKKTAAVPETACIRPKKKRAAVVCGAVFTGMGTAFTETGR